MRLIILTLCLSVVLCHAQLTLGIRLVGTNAVIRVTNTSPALVYQMQRSADTLTWAELFPFRGSTNVVSTNVVRTIGARMFRVASQPQIVTNILPTSFRLYPYIPGTWYAYPTLNHSDFIGAHISIDGIVWVVYVHSGNFLEIRTQNTYANPPVFHVGDEVMLLD